jgi:uncharacterized protein YlzI (FlbEa/FlbD family)
MDGIIQDWIVGWNKKRPEVITLKCALTRRRKMPCTATTALIALLVFGLPSVVLADTNNRTGHHGLFVQRPMSTMFNGRTWAVNDAAKPFNAEEKGSFAASPLVPSAPFCRGGSSGRTKPWIELTAPGGEPVHINVEQIASIRPETEIPGVRTQLDLASGKFQRVQENVEQVMQLISATSDTRENDETPSAAPKLRRFN